MDRQPYDREGSGGGNGQMDPNDLVKYWQRQHAKSTPHSAPSRDPKGQADGSPRDSRQVVSWPEQQARHADQQARHDSAPRSHAHERSRVDARFSAQGNSYAQQRGQDVRSEAAAYDISNYKSRPGKVGRFGKGKIAAIIVAAVILLLVIPGIALAVSAKGAMSDARVLVNQGQVLADQVMAGDIAGAKQTTQELSETAKKLNDNVNSPLWAVATLIPVYGEDVRQVRTLASVANTLCQDALDPVVENMPAGGFKDIVVDGGVNVEPLQRIILPLGEASGTITACAEQVNGMGESHFEQLAGPVATLKGFLGTLAAVSEHAADLAELLPAMLGADGPRTYLLIAANNAEIRSTGGMAGSFGLVTVDNGRISVGDFVGSDVAPRPETVEPAITAEEEHIFGLRTQYDIRDTCYIPDFPRAAALEKGIWEASGNPAINGVIMIDPIFLQRILALTGGVTTSDGTVVDGGNAAQLLLNETYLRLGDDNAAQDAFFAETAGLALHKILENLGDVNFVGLLDVISSSFNERRLYLWMANPEEEAILSRLGVTGEASTSEEEPVTGIYLAAASGGKIFWYLDADATMSPGRKNADGTTSYDVTLTLNNTLSEEAAAGMSWYITGEAEIKRTVNDMHLDVYLYAPMGGSITNMQTTGFFFDSSEFGGGWQTWPGNDPMTPATYDGREVWYGITALNGTEPTTIKYTVTTSANAKQELQLDMTPLANENI